MNWLKNISRMLVACVLVAMTGIASAQYVAGTHYDEVAVDPALRELQTPGDKPQITELFWYGCPHCNAFDPLLDAWVAEKGAAITFARLPVAWNAITQQHARMFFTAKTLGVGAQLHRPFFDAIHQQHNSLAQPAAIEQFFVAHGVPAEKFNGTFESFVIDSMLRKHAATMTALQVPGVPAMLLNGRYIVQYGTEAVPTQQAMLEVVDFLLQQKP
ncbi:MAG: thiol:disulfide interchange protein DsbA/DsbL [Pseudomonadota bacterium]